MIHPEVYIDCGLACFYFLYSLAIAAIPVMLDSDTVLLNLDETILEVVVLHFFEILLDIILT